MTGKDLIVYILQHDLEDCEIDDILSNMFLNESQLAAKVKVGVGTIRAWREMKRIKGITIKGIVYFYTDTKDPRENTNE